ncbi:hypothetical protein CYMTET_32163 [Cymbomonas tetramitiformis]|uniref:Uncharacterized protein n=1 Tax=Cymbomonas tetramitiformis TaxID=36881 RepID=A0AAE0FFN3_9CHLO|nr:hypothetical protein CYMTET_32163 [Cymbomonas tetramitiformis]|eukprot:gene27918-34499_t
MNLAVSDDGTYIEWESPKHPDVMLTNLNSPISLVNAGDEAILKMKWKSDGQNTCPAEDWADHKYCKDDFPCAHTSVNCLAGTGDLRIGLLDTNGAGYVDKDGFADSTSYGEVSKILSSSPFSTYKGYNFRIFPHVSTKAERYSDGGAHVPCSINFKEKDANVLSDERLALFGCFETPRGQWTDFTLEIRRESSEEIRLKMTMNGIAYEHYHRMDSEAKKHAPSKIDVVVIQYPNGRGYEYFKLGTPSSSSERIAGAARLWEWVKRVIW